MKELFQRLWHLYLIHRDIIAYLIGGVLTTIVNYSAYFILTRGVGIDYFWSNIHAWWMAVVFGFLINKTYVFHCWEWALRTVFREAWQFTTARVATGVLETGSLWFFVDCLHCNDGIVKVVAGFVVVVLNYIFSKFIIFAKRKKMETVLTGTEEQAKP